MRVERRTCIAVTAAAATIVLAAFTIPATAEEHAAPGMDDTPRQSETLVLTGNLRAANADRLFAPFTDSWQLQLKWLIEEGTEVQPGDAVARFDPGNAENNLATAEDALAAKLQNRVLQETEGRLHKLDLDLALVRADIEHEKAKIHAAIPEGIEKGKDYRQRQLDLQRREQEFEAAKLNLKTYEATHASTMATQDIEIRQLRDDIERYSGQLKALELRATRQGLVVHEEHPWQDQKFKEGDQVQATWQVASIPDLNTLEVIAWAAEPDLPQVHAGQRTRLTLDAYPARPLTGEVVEVWRAGDQHRQWGDAPYFQVRITLDSLDTTIMRPGMSVRCELEATR